MYPAGQKNTPKITDAPRQSNIIQVIRAATQNQPHQPKLSVITGTMLNCPTPLAHLPTLTNSTLKNRSGQSSKTKVF